MGKLSGKPGKKKVEKDKSVEERIEKGDCPIPTCGNWRHGGSSSMSIKLWRSRGDGCKRAPQAVPEPIN